MNLPTAALTTLSVLMSSDAPSSWTPQEHGSESQQQVDQVNVTKVVVRIEKIDPDKHVMTVKPENGKEKTLKVDKSVKDRGFAPGDIVRVCYTQEIIVMAEHSDKHAAQLAKYGAVDVEAEGEKPALVKVDTSETTGKILSIDTMKHRLTFADPDGKKRTVKLSYKIKDLDRFEPSETINMAITDEIVVEIDPWGFTR